MAKQYLRSSFLYMLILSLLFGCGLATTRPKEEMSMAAAAILAAKRARAEIRAPAEYRKAEFYFLKSKSYYKRKFFNKAKQFAQISQKFSEQAEYVAQRKALLEKIQ
jgi:hypothetical protein